VTIRWIPALLLAAACAGGSSSAAPAPNRTPESTVTAFLAAARDTNVIKMADLWGGPSGPAGQTKQPSDYEKRIRIMQVYLVSDSAKVAGTGSVDGHPEQTMVTMKIFRGKCTNLVPFVLGKWKDGYLVQNVDVSAAGNPAKPCDDNGNPIAG
jgi:hypothetical protein